MNKNYHQCTSCIPFQTFTDDNEYYWHLKVHNAETERDLLNKEMDLVYKKLALLEKKET